MQITLPDTQERLALRLAVDFDVRANLAEAAEFSKLQQGLMKAILASPYTLRQVGRLALETELARASGNVFEGLFDGPRNEEILECILPCLPESAKAHWRRLRDEPGDALHDNLVPVFLAFEVKLRRAGIRELSDTSEPLIRKNAVPILDAQQNKG